MFHSHRPGNRLSRLGTYNTAYRGFVANNPRVARGERGGYFPIPVLNPGWAEVYKIIKEF